jgi:YgiT-type zinc finger domain-containing protein
MKCAICHEGHTKPGFINSKLERNGVIAIIKEVPALICDKCGEEYLEDGIAGKLLAQAEDVFNSGKPVEIIDFAA